MRWARLASVVSVGVGAVACAAIWGFDDLKPGSSFMDGGQDADDSATADSGPPCSLDHPEDPTGDPGGAINFLVAVDSFDIGTYRDAGGLDGSRAIAYDLDNVCTCHGPNEESCIRPSDQSTCDDLRGRDDVGRILLATLQTFVDVTNFTSEGATEKLANGQFGILIQVQGYNGANDDSDVTVYILPSFGMGTITNGVIGKPFIKPTFSKTDTWSFDSRFASKLNPSQIIGNGNNPNAKKGWVRNGRLIARFDDLFIDFQLDVTNGNPLLIHITDAIASAKINKSGTDYQLDEGRISGRWATGDLLRAIGAWELNNGIPGPLCVNAEAGAYPAVKNIVCGKRDISAKGVAPTKNCDALSFGLGFSAKPASVGDPASFPYKTTVCFNGTSPLMLGNYPDDCP